MIHLEIMMIVLGGKFYYMTDNWSKIVSPVLDAYNNSPHSTTKIAPYKVNKYNDFKSINEY